MGRGVRWRYTLQLVRQRKEASAGRILSYRKQPYPDSKKSRGGERAWCCGSVVGLLGRYGSGMGSVGGFSVHHHAEQPVGQGWFVVNRAEEGVRAEHGCGGDRRDCCRM
jgi:hypothetical protein